MVAQRQMGTIQKTMMHSTAIQIIMMVGLLDEDTAKYAAGNYELLIFGGLLFGSTQQSAGLAKGLSMQVQQRLFSECLICFQT